MQKPYISRLGSNWEVLDRAGGVILSTTDYEAAKVALDREFARLATIEGLRIELHRCPATPAGYREAAYLRARIAVYEAAK